MRSIFIGDTDNPTREIGVSVDLDYRDGLDFAITIIEDNKITYAITDLSVAEVCELSVALRKAAEAYQEEE